MKSHLKGRNQLKRRSLSTTMIRAACTVAFASVAIAATVPVLANAASAAAVGASRDSLSAGAFATVNAVAVPPTQLDDTVQALASRAGRKVAAIDSLAPDRRVTIGRVWPAEPVRLTFQRL
ncbi:hypothetical protein [Paraburkholderia adhaesiva]|uniref:hypothetical protein n=1 Tax=Paraburkholderia adhaesiva TaxID=2883244 RepID=UPI001F305617|nr:hypothetical protein [Paraburkholderia adhaesiva]